MVFPWKRNKGPASSDSQSAAPAAPNAAEEEPKRADVRVRLLPLHGISFEMSSPEKLRIEVVNLGPDGVGLYRNSRDAWPQIGATIRGELSVAGSHARLELEIVHISGLVVGCRALKPSSELRELIRSFFDVEVAATRLRQANSAALKKDPDGEPQWFLGQNNCELFLIHAGERLVRFELTLYGAHLSGASGEALKFGFVVDDEPTGALKYKGSAIIHGVSRVPEEMVSKSIRFVENIPGLSPALRSAISELIRG